MKADKTYLTSVLVGMIIGLFFISCKKEPITPGNYQAGTPETTTVTPMTNGGTLPTIGTATVTPNQCNGTKWVLIDVYNNYAHVSKSDTVYFISNNRYKINSDTTQYTYILYSTMGNSTIVLNTFIPINGLNLTANNFNANAFTSVPVGGTIQLTLKDIFSSSSIYTSTFKKI